MNYRFVSETVPEIPTVAESGNLYGIYRQCPARHSGTCRTNPEIVRKLNAKIRKALASTEVRGQLEAQATEPAIAGEPKDFGLYLAAETKKWSEVAKASGITPN